MIISLFTVFMFFVLVREAAVELPDRSTTANNLEFQSSQESLPNQQDEDCRYQDGTIPRRDLSNYVVDSELNPKLTKDAETGTEENEIFLDTTEPEDVEVELNQTTPNQEDEDR